MKASNFAMRTEDGKAARYGGEERYVSRSKERLGMKSRAWQHVVRVAQKETIDFKRGKKLKGLARSLALPE